MICNMCYFCKDIKRISYGEEIESAEKDFAREKIILCYIDDKLCFYWFNKYHYEDDAYYGNADINAAKNILNEGLKQIA